MALRCPELSAHGPALLQVTNSNSKTGNGDELCSDARDRCACEEVAGDASTGAVAGLVSLIVWGIMLLVTNFKRAQMIGNTLFTIIGIVLFVELIKDLKGTSCRHKCTDSEPVFEKVEDIDVALNALGILAAVLAGYFLVVTAYKDYNRRHSAPRVEG